MKINQNEEFPDTEFFKMTDSGPKSIKSSDLFNKSKVILIGVPGAFTPTCNDEHIPGYVRLLDQFLAAGIEKIYIVANNDPFVMKRWEKSFDNEKIDFLSDGNGVFRNISGLETDLSVVGLGKRLSRFAIYIDNGVIKKIFNENGPGLDSSKAENVLKFL